MSNLGEIRAKVRSNLGEATARFYNNGDLNNFIGEAYQKYTLELIQNADGYFETRVNLAITAGNPLISLASLNPVFLRISALEKNMSSGQSSTVPLRPSERRFTINTNLMTGTGDSYLPTWKLESNNLVLEPTPQASEAAADTSGLRLTYVYLPTYPTSTSLDSFTFDANFKTIFEPMVVLYATVAALESKDGMGGVSDIASFRERLKYFEQSFEDSLERIEYPDFVQYIGGNYTNLGNWYNWR